MATVPKPTIAHEEELIRALAKEWQQHYNARNIDKLLPLYTADGSIMAPFYPMATGATAMRQYFFDVLQQNDPHDLTVETFHVEITGDIAFGTGSFKDNLKLPNGERMDVPGKWISVMRHVGGDWKIFAHCWNTDLPINTMTT